RAGARRPGALARRMAATRTSKHTWPSGASFFPTSLLDGYVPPVPDNMDEIRERMARRRDSVSPSRISDADIEKFRSEIYWLENENAVKAQCLPYFEGDLTLDDSVFTERETVFNNLKHLTDG